MLCRQLIGKGLGFVSESVDGKKGDYNRANEEARPVLHAAQPPNHRVKGS